MKAIETFKLIEGTYTTEDATEILSSLIADKIRFHHTNILSMTERNVGDVSHSEARVVALKQVKKDISALLEEAEKLGVKLEINSTIEIKAVPASKAKQQNRELVTAS